MKIKFTSLVLLGLSLTSFSQIAQTDKIERFDSLMSIAFEITQNLTPSISIAIVNGDNIVYNTTLGYQDVENKIKATNDTQYYIASITKSFTGVLASKLHFENKIDLNQPFDSYLSGTFTDKNIGPSKISVQDLLTHSSGLENDALTTRAAFTGYSSKEDMFSCLYKSTTLKKDRSGIYNYDNLGYNIYSRILEEQLNDNWKNMLQEQVFKPLGLKNTTAFVKNTNKNIAKNYVLSPNGPEVVYLQKENNTMHSAGGIYSTTEDLAYWIMYNMNTKIGSLDPKVFNYATSQLLKVDSVKRSVEPFEMNGYGLGWKTGSYKNNNVI